MERALEMTCRQAALPSYIRERHTTKVGTDRHVRSVPQGDIRPCPNDSGDRAHLWLLGRTDLRRADRLSHSIENDNALATTTGRKRLAGVGVTAVDILPVV